MDSENISAESYAALMQMVDTYEENVKILLEIFTGMEEVDIEELVIR